VKRLLVWMAVATAPALTAALILWAAMHIGMLPVSRTTVEAVNRWIERPFSLDVRDRHGERIAMILPPDGPRREFLALSATPPFLVDALVLSEDRRFFEHRGVDAEAVLRAVWTSIRAGRLVSGASTITMQLARMLRPHSGGLDGKLREAWMAVELERILSKQEILELWINALPFGMNSEGIGAGSRLIYARSPDELTAAEMTLLAVVPRNPYALHPGRNPGAAVAAASHLVKRASIPVTVDQLRNAAAGSVTPSEASLRAFANEAPHFVQAVVRSIEPARLTTGEPFITSLDLEMQRHLTRILADGVRESADRRISHAAALVLDNRSGEIRAWVGSVAPTGSSPGDQIDGVRVRNPSGSTLKPFLYAMALDRGFSKHSLLPDRRMQFGSEDAYLPVNFSRRFSGTVSLQTALASSLNVPAVYLADRIGVLEVADMLASLGFADAADRRDQLGHGIAVGNVEVSLLELVRAFSLFPRAGTLPEPSFLSVPRNRANPDAVSWSPDQSTVLSSDSVVQVGEILGDWFHRAPGFGVSSRLSTPFAAMFKTGTANQFSDIWAVGAIPELTAGVWMGNHQGRTVAGQTGSSLPASILVDFFLRYAVAGERFDAKLHSPPRSGGAAGANSAGAGFAELTGAHLLYPGNGAVFIFDPRLHASQQGIPIEAVIADGGVLSILINKEIVASGRGRIRLTVPLGRGRHIVELVTESGVVSSVELEVR
jgi:penicillin-binding protein 1C